MAWPGFAPVEYLRGLRGVPAYISVNELLPGCQIGGASQNTQCLYWCFFFFFLPSQNGL